MRKTSGTGMWVKRKKKKEIIGNNDSRKVKKVRDFERSEFRQ